MKRGERKARWMLDRLDKAGVTFKIVPTENGGRGIAFPDSESHSPEQRELAVDLVMFAIGFPRCFGTLVRLHAEREVTV